MRVNYSNGLGLRQWTGAERQYEKLEQNEHLQLFADNGDGDPEGESNGGGTGSEDSKGMSFDDFLKEGGNQAEFDRRMQKAIQTSLTRKRKSGRR